jgi:hypothetical protein
MSLFQSLSASFLNPTYGWKTTHFWGPIANWGLVVAAVYDATFKSPEIIDIPMTSTMIGYSSLFIRFALKVKPTNYLLFACHCFNVAAQCNQLRRAINYKLEHNPGAKKEFAEKGKKGAMLLSGLAGVIAFSGKLQNIILKSPVPSIVQRIVAHPAGPMTIFFWAPTSKWLLSANNLVDLDKPTNKMSLAQQLALTTAGAIWCRYALVITPKNWNLCIVNVALALSSGYHVVRKIKADYFGK